MSSSRKRMLSGSLMSIFIMNALIALNHKLGVLFWHSVGICRSEAPCFRRKLSTLYQSSPIGTITILHGDSVLEH
jgi:hypothetical protein